MHYVWYEASILFLRVELIKREGLKVAFPISPSIEEGGTGCKKIFYISHVGIDQYAEIFKILKKLLCQGFWKAKSLFYHKMFEPDILCSQIIK